MISFALLGAGRIGRVHAGNVARHPGAELRAVYDSHEPAAAALAKQYACSIRSPEAIFAAGDIDAVIIASPANTHATFVEDAALAGKAIFCEKPFDIEIGRARRCCELVRSTRVPLFLAFNRRFDASFANLQLRLSGGEIGRPELVLLTSRDPEAPSLDYIAQSGGLFRDMMVHDFDVARWLLGEELDTVYAIGGCFENPAIADLGFVDTALVTMMSASGIAVSINCAMRAAYGYDQRVEVHASRGILTLGNHFETSVTCANAKGFSRELPLQFFTERYVQAYERELNYFIDCLNQGLSPSPNYDDGLRALILGEAAQQSYESRRAVIVKEVLVD